MDRAMQERRLAEAEGQIEEGRQGIEKQRELIATLHRGGYDTGPATELLTTLLATQREREAHRDRLRDEWREIAPKP